MIARFSPILFLLLAVLLSGCSDEGQSNISETNDAAKDVAKELQRETESKKTEAKKQAKFEPLNKNLRIIGEGDIAAPIIEGNELERLNPSTNSEEKNAQQTARIPDKPDLFPRPLVLSAGKISSKGISISFSGINLPEKEEMCISSEGRWPCGNFAKAALQRLIRTRTLSCTGEFVGTTQYVGDCKVGNTAIKDWLAQQGWAKTAEGATADLISAAKASNKGLWRD